MPTNTVFQNLFIFEMANNHMGDFKHGINIIREVFKVTRHFNFNFGFKLQYRNLNTFIHPEFQMRKDIKYVRRFSETRLSNEKLKEIKDEIQRLGFLSICTPFDEDSVDLIERHNFDVIKIGSCSFTDWPLLERIARTEKPIILSTAGVHIEEIDRVVSFFEHRRKNFCLMHCVGEYPTLMANLQLNQIDLLKKRYPDIPIGYSTHEEPDNTDAIKVAIAKGATVFERHVGLRNAKYGINDYSSTPGQIKKWLIAARETFLMCGASNVRKISDKEIFDLRGLKRGVFAKRLIPKGEKIDSTNSFFAIPNFENQILANDLSKYTQFTAKRNIGKNKPIKYQDVETINLRDKVLKIMHRIKQILIESQISLPHKIEFELSHHYGIDKFEKWGATIINYINREYCKKLIILLPGQRHPLHYHRKKEETFNVLYGKVDINIDGNEKEYKPGDMIIIERGVRHNFGSKNGAIFEEISTKHYNADSYYDDKRIVTNRERKTVMTFWSDWLIKPLS